VSDDPVYYYYAIYRRGTLWATLAARSPTSGAAHLGAWRERGRWRVSDDPVYYYYAIYRRGTLWGALAARSPTSAATVASKLGIDSAELTLASLDASTFHRFMSGLEIEAPGGEQ
jgi:hypothetical protein